MADRRWGTRPRDAPSIPKIGSDAGTTRAVVGLWERCAGLHGGIAAALYLIRRVRLQLCSTASEKSGAESGLARKKTSMRKLRSAPTEKTMGIDKQAERGRHNAGCCHQTRIL